MDLYHINLLENKSHWRHAIIHEFCFITKLRWIHCVHFPLWIHKLVLQTNYHSVFTVRSIQGAPCMFHFCSVVLSYKPKSNNKEWILTSIVLGVGFHWKSSGNKSPQYFQHLLWILSNFIIWGFHFISILLRILNSSSRVLFPYNYISDSKFFKQGSISFQFCFGS